MAILGSVFNIAMAAFGLGFVIFIHELGHFLLAKANGVKVEKFSIGFGPSIFQFQRGETVYALAALPLGGFVKMLGEGDGEEAEKSSDPRSYQNKSVGQRMSIISAGVIMNLIFGMLCFIIYYSKGAIEIPARLGGVVSGSPAFEAGLEPGDEIISIDGKTQVDFLDLKSRVALSGAGSKVKLQIHRPGQEKPIEIVVEPEIGADQQMPTIGIVPSLDTQTSKGDPYLPPAGSKGPLGGDVGGLVEEDKIVEAGPSGGTLEPIESIQDYNAILAKHASEPIDVVFERKEKKAADSSASPTIGEKEKALKRVKATLPAANFVDFGIRVKMKPIASVSKGSPAEKAGFLKGDRIVTVNGSTEFDPLRLPTLCFENAGKEMTFEVERPIGGAKVDAKDADKTSAPKAMEIKTLKVVPSAQPPWLERLISKSRPLKLPGLGIAYGFEPLVTSVKPDSPADKMGVKKGDKLLSLRFVDYSMGSTSGPMFEKFELDAGPSAKDDAKDRTFDDFSAAFEFLQVLPRQAVVLSFLNEKPPVLLVPDPVADWYFPGRGLRFREERKTLPPLGVLPAIERGFEDTVDSIGSVYASLRGLVQNRLSRKNMGGPLKIAQYGYEAASGGLITLIHFLGILSVNLAVLNFLPITPFDGGHFFFLLIEKIIGRPVPESVHAAAQWTGVVLVLVLFVLITFQDLVSFF